MEYFRCFLGALYKKGAFLSFFCPFQIPTWKNPIFYIYKVKYPLVAHRKPVETPTYYGYRRMTQPLSWSMVNEFLNDLTIFLDFLLSLSSEPVLIGDFNIDSVKHASMYARYTDLLSGFNLVQHVNVLTHIHGGILDHFITLADSDLLCKELVINYCLSDHMCLLACLNADVHPSSTPKPYSFRKYNSIDLTALKNELLSTQLITSPCSTSCAGLYDQYASTRTSILDKFAPLCTSKFTRPAEKWLSAAFFDAKQKKPALERKWRRTKTAEDRSKFRRQVNKCNSILQVSKSHYYSDLVKNSLDDSKKLWKTLNKILHRTKSSTLPDDTTDSALADKFGSYFIEKIKKIRAIFLLQ